jgi:tetratricopeptide (TPR) repeat protein
MNGRKSLVPSSFLLLFFSLSLQILLTSCADKAVPPVSVASPVAPSVAGSDEKRDLSCSYFYFLWGTHAESNKKYSEAQDAYEKALICDPDADYVLKKLPILLLKMGKQHAAAQWLRDAVEKNPNDIDSQLLLARLDVNFGDLDGAIRIYEKILELAPDNTTVRLRLGYLYSQQGRYKEGEETIKVLLLKDPDSYLALLYLARLAVQSADFEGAAAFYEKILPHHWSPELVFEMAELYGKREQYKRVEELYASVLKKEPKNEQAALGRVHALLLSDQEKEALEELARIRQFSKNTTNIDLITSRVLIRMRKFDKANALLEKVLAREESSAARYMLAVVRYEANKKEAALAHLRKISHGDVEFEDSVTLRTRILIEVNKSAEAMAFLQKLIDKSDRRQPQYYILLAELYAKADQPGAAHEILTKGIELYPDNVSLLFAQGLLLEQEKRQDEAIAAMEKVVALQPDHVEALNYLGYTWADTRVNLDKALEYIRKAQSLKPGNGFILDSLGWVYFRMGDLEKARVEMEHAVALEPGDPNIHDHLGDIYEASGLKEKARSAWRKAKELFKETEMKEKMQQKIDASR